MRTRAAKAKDNVPGRFYMELEKYFYRIVT